MVHGVSSLSNTKVMPLILNLSVQQDGLFLNSQYVFFRNLPTPGLSSSLHCSFSGVSAQQFLKQLTSQCTFSAFLQYQILSAGDFCSPAATCGKIHSHLPVCEQLVKNSTNPNCSFCIHIQELSPTESRNSLTMLAQCHVPLPAKLWQRAEIHHVDQSLPRDNFY